MVLDGKIYVMGGEDEGGFTLDTAEVYDPQANGWQRVASMPQGLCKHAAAALGGKIYVTGVATNQGTLTVDVYDPQANAWTPLASMSNARRLHASAVVGDKLYVFGGYAAGGRLSMAYDPASDSWAQVTSLTSARNSMVAIAL